MFAIKRQLDVLCEKRLLELGKRFGEHAGEVLSFIQKTDDKEKIASFLLVLRDRNSDIASESNVHFCVAFAKQIKHIKSAVRTEVDNGK